MRKPTENKGFTLIEILLVVVIIGIMLAVIVPRAWRANVDTKYNLVRQNCNELASFGMQWVEQQMQAQPESDGTTQRMYLDSLANDYVARSTKNWIGYNAVNSRVLEASVQDIVPPEKHPRNPFNGASVFVSANNPTAAGHVVAGAMGCIWATEATVPGYRYYAFLWQGTDSTTTAGNLATTWHAGQAFSLDGARNGVFFARAR